MSDHWWSVFEDGIRVLELLPYCQWYVLIALFLSAAVSCEVRNWPSIANPWDASDSRMFSSSPKSVLCFPHFFPSSPKSL